VLWKIEKSKDISKIMNLLKFATAGSVDHGKSTLLGRILYDLNQLKDDQIEALHEDGSLNLAFATDGLSAERSQGITIDVAYRYFNIDNKRYVSVDAPGHEEFTRNAFTAFTQVHAVILVVDVERDDYNQFYKHLALCEMLLIPNIAVVINKIDAVNYDEVAYRNKVEVLKNDDRWPSKLSIQFIPASALVGDNVIHKTEKTSWYSGSTIFEFLEKCSIPKMKGILHVQKKYGDSFQGTIFGKINSDILKDFAIDTSTINGKTWDDKIELEDGSWECSFRSDDKLDGRLYGTEIITSAKVQVKLFNVSEFEITTNQENLAIQTIAGLYDIEHIEIKITLIPNAICEAVISLKSSMDYSIYDFGNVAGRFTIVNKSANSIIAGGVIIA